MTKNITLILILVIIKCSIGESNFTQLEILQGYKQDNGRVIFIFDECTYAVSPNKVVIEGSFREWDHDMSDPQWLMMIQAILWREGYVSP